MNIWETITPTKRRKELIVFNNMIADMESNKKVSPAVPELFTLIWGWWRGGAGNFTRPPVGFTLITKK